MKTWGMLNMIEDEISVKELIQILLKGWRTIIGIIIITSILGLVLIFSFNRTTYTEQLNGSITTIDQYVTSFGTYKTNIAKIDDYVNSINNSEYLSYLNEFVDVPFTITAKVVNTNDFTFQVKSSNNLASNSVAKVILNSFSSYLNYNLQAKAVSFFIVENELNISKINASLEENTLLLADYKDKLSETNMLINSNILNPSFEIIQKEVTNLELMELRYSNNLEILSQNRKKLDNYILDSYESYRDNSEHMNQISVNIRLVDNIKSTTEKQFEPVLTLSIALILGFMLGAFIVLFLNYWKNN